MTNALEIAVVGAGSHFTLHLLRSVVQSEPDSAYRFRFMDNRPEALEALGELLPRLRRHTDVELAFSLHDDARAALSGADHVLVSFATDFPDAFLRSCWVMRDHGIQFVEGETATPGALMATLRHLPPLVELTAAVAEETDGAWIHVINNPLSRLLLGVRRASGYERVVGHCHGTIELRAQLAYLTGTDGEQIDLFVAGINHFHLVQRALHIPDGRDLLAELLAGANAERWRERDFTQWRMAEELGHVIGHGHWHNFDYLPYANPRMFRHKDWNTWERACLAEKARRASAAGAEAASRLAGDDALAAFLGEREIEQMLPVMRALSGLDGSYRFLSGNAPNDGRIAGLPDEAIVELPAQVTSSGVALDAPERPLPLFFQTWLQPQVAAHELSVRAALEGSREAAIEAIACDAAFRDCDCPPAQLLDELLAVNEGLVPRLS